MDGHIDAPESTNTPQRPFLKLCLPPVGVALAGLLITAFAAHSISQHLDSLNSTVNSAVTVTNYVWIAGLAISALGALACGVIGARWHRQTREAIAIRQEHQVQSRELNNVKTEKRILRQALDDSEQRSRDLVSMSGGIVCELDEHRNVGYVSAGVTDMLGIAPADLAGTTIESLVCQSDQNTLGSALQAARQDRQLQRVELELIAANQQPLPATLRVLALHDTLHGFCGFRLTLQPRH